MRNARRARSAMTPTATPTPTPALPPVLRPLCGLREVFVSVVIGEDEDFVVEVCCREGGY
jgi:hypothetical protein